MKNQSTQCGVAFISEGLMGLMGLFGVHPIQKKITSTLDEQAINIVKQAILKSEWYAKWS
jgi:uncharacterized membrane protein YgdD (TMEM256/DUF423 family)